ncbi:MAG: twin-arginine translocation pathway signal protein [Sulfurimonas sp. RIFOXYD12_FULL_33_39]|uniref:FAD-dependent oxidoreductase n=1 Tax=unclassified Sulfurimonas TaxID=2623549 RepID=UPI0008C67F69|nr:MULTISPECIES: FAD-dependent oxidoreductase [unclassified Sulfurimonas]OHE02812.1 MAG: twin-arginine translocation pathway signal protein [Sulfurimonas sp. RIFCSPLOWO2_12_FULL_34_6]OHE09933.1 MAG: twin-arginine translocation pathway signal protein [Sulfurimonas sp. RIFOXYD12_FULL_33_39]OHE13559.1 MAG: twin-arginine translocation pathway signal protein [Sulfurimonas sp. RIFOXYD2_FULL_34_21]
MAISRRDALALSGLAVASSALSASADSMNKKQNQNSESAINYKAPLPDTTNPRVVVVGGGWSGLSIAKYTKIFAPNADVVLVEQRHEFTSCPLSNLWLVDKIELEYLTHDYLQAARKNNYTYFHATAVDLDKENQILKTSDGNIKYDYLVFAPGIDYDYSRWTKDIAFENRLRQEYPAGFIPGSEHITLRNKVLNFKGGNFILTVPSGNYRCLPAPYERACVIADYFKQKKLDAKVILLDENNSITIKEKGFKSAFDELYADYIEYVPGTAISKIDLDNKVVHTEFEQFKFEDAAFYPHIRGAKILERVGLAKDAKNKLEANINPLTYEAIDAKNVFITGDSRPMGFSKSGNTSNSEGHFVASIIARKINKTTKIKWEPPTTTCFSAVSIAPERAIYIYTQYSYDKISDTFDFADTVSSEDWKKDGKVNANSIYSWATALYTDMFN